MADAIICPACGASNAPGAQWCGQCFVGFDGASTPLMPADRAPAGASPSPPAPPATRNAPERPPSDPPRPPGIPRTDRSEPVPPPVPAAPPEDQSWTCAVCGSTNPVSVDVCTSCNTSIFTAFGADEDERPDVEASSAALWSLIPGGGHFRTGQGALGLAVAGLIVSSLIFGLLLLGGNRRPIGIVLLLVGVVAWGVSVYDATRFAAGDDGATVLRPRVITAVMGLVFAAVIIAAVSLTGGETP